MPQCENINIFGYLGGRGINNQTGSILVHIYPLIYINLHVRHGSYLIRTFGVKIKNMKKKNCGGPGARGGGLHNIHGHWGHQDISKCRPHHSGDICTTIENKAIRDGRPRPPRHQCVYQISS